jgi:bifunctional DNA-binding transcriptional regulator/antitoxin component of YhaV-PrlF toxin-antitoxin module
MNSTTVTTFIRDRGQITLPYTIRDMFPWVKVSAPITIVANHQTNTITLQPNTHAKNWSTMWQQIELARSFYSPDDAMSGSDFIAWDRKYGHRF